MEGWMGLAEMIEALMPRSCRLEREGRDESRLALVILAAPAESDCRPRERSAEREVDLAGEAGVVAFGCGGCVDSGVSLLAGDCDADVA